MNKITTVLFDLDGTLIDTAPDMARALNLLLEEQQYPMLPYEKIRPVVSNGSQALVNLGFQDTVDAEKLEQLKQRYLEIYESNLCVESRLFDGLASILERIEQQHMKWGVVTNKPGWLTEPLLQQLQLSERSSCIVSGDTTAYRKPHPEPMLYACKQAGSKPAECLYIGDARRDIEAGRNAGMTTMVAAYGYIGEWENVDSWNADLLIQHPSELDRILF